MGTFILVHGAWHGGWCWQKVVPLLERAGHAAIAPDLPAHGADQTPLREATLQSYADRVVAVIDAQAEPVTLVGHSMGGLPISLAAERRPERVRGLVYLAAILLRDGEVVRDIFRGDAHVRATAHAFARSEDGSFAVVRPEAAGELFYHDCSAEDAAWATAQLRPEPTGWDTTPVHVTEANFGRVPRCYIACLQDRAIHPNLQEQLYTASPCRRVVQLDTSHSPFLSAPQQLVDSLLSL